MASITSNEYAWPPDGPYARLLTVADLAAMPSELPSGDVHYELDDGRLIVTPPPGNEHGLVQGEFAAELVTHVRNNGLGRVWIETGVVLWRNPDRCIGPDLCFIAQHRLPPKVTPEGYLETIPDLVVEIRSKNDTRAYLKRKAEDYLKAGVRLVWVVEPEAQIVVEYRPNRAAQQYEAAATLSCDDVVPGFQLPLAQLFRM
ncbi:MAG: Uma2 family endonuclease [Pirellulales bacterium]